MVLEFSENGPRGFFFWSKNPEWNEYGEKATNVNDQHQSLNQWHFSCEESIERHCKGGNGNDDKRPMPSLEDIIRIIDYQQTLNLNRDEVRAASDVDLPC